MRFIALLWDWLLYALVFAAFSIGTIAVHAPDVLTAYPKDLPAMTESELLQTMDGRIWP